MRPRDRHLPGINDDADVPFGLVGGVEVLAALEADRGECSFAAAGLPAQEVRAGEGGDEGVPRSRDELGRRPELPQPALDEDAHLVGQRGRVLVVVGHEERRQGKLPQQLRELVPHLGFRVRVERRERLVEEEHGGFAGERARERDPLPFAARELRRLRRGQVSDPEPVEQLVDGASARAERDVSAHAEVWEERVVLEDQADAPPLGRQRHAPLRVEPLLPVEQDAAAGRLNEARDDAQHGGLACAGGADERDGARNVEREL